MDDLRENVAHKDNIGVYFSPLMDVRTSDGDLDFWKKVVAARPMIEAAGFHPRAYNEPSMRFKANHCMADGGSIVIEPDGSLYSCEHCPSNGRFGDVFHGVTDEATKTEFCRSDRTREKCRKCPFLPECTSFASCPWTDAHCREMREMLTLDFLKRLIDRKTNTEEPDGDDSVC
jgi:radical SAM protein with 4Fe4S-binding SPASM domain